MSLNIFIGSFKQYFQISLKQRSNSVLFRLIFSLYIGPVISLKRLQKSKIFKGSSPKVFHSNLFAANHA